MRTASWILREKATGRVVGETFNPGDPKRWWSDFPKASELDFDGVVAKIKFANPAKFWTLKIEEEIAA